MLLDAIAESSPWKSWPGGLGEYSSQPGLILAKPLTYMNESGRFVAEIARFYKASSAEILVCFDDMDIPLGRIRLREKGSAGGHNGMRSIIESLGTDQIPRLRLGIGPKPMEFDAAAFVLSAFRADESDALERMISSAKDAVFCALDEGGIAKAMTRYNFSPEDSIG